MSILSTSYASAADRAAAWSQARSSSISSFAQQNSAALSTITGESSSGNSISSMLAGSAGGDGSLISMLGGSTDTSSSEQAASLFGGGLGSTAEEALQAAVSGSVSDSVNLEENVMAAAIRTRLAKAQAAADPQPGMVFHRIA